jgi:sugar phosphate isomerase/epimerase
LRRFSRLCTGILPGKSYSEREYALLRQYGIDSVEIGTEQAGAALDSSSLYDKFVAFCKGAQPPVSAIHAPFWPDHDFSVLDQKRREVALNHATAALELANRSGVNLVVIHGSEDPISAGTRGDRLAQAHQSLAELVPRAKALNVRLALEMMPPEWLPAGVDEALAMVEGLDPKVIGFCLDTNHANLTGDLSEIVHALGQRIWDVHLSDNDGRKQQHWMPFQGIIDWQGFLAALNKARYVGPLHYEVHPHPAGPERGLQEIKENFGRLLALSESETPL